MKNTFAHCIAAMLMALSAVSLHSGIKLLGVEEKTAIDFSLTWLVALVAIGLLIIVSGRRQGTVCYL